MSAKVFVGTNLLVYAYDGRFPEKKRRSRDRMAELADSGLGVISTQVMQEFFAAATRKLGIDAVTAKSEMQAWTRPFEVVQVVPAMIYDAIDLVTIHRISFWDSLLVAAAATAHCTRLLTEDLAAGQVLRGVTIVNPFA